ncbi:14769_t:CDS:1, partial [Gigaspora rosea]
MDFVLSFPVLLFGLIGYEVTGSETRWLFDSLGPENLIVFERLDSALELDLRGTSLGLAGWTEIFNKFTRYRE